MSRRLSDAERNYHVGDLELLAVKLALEEWRHWLERWCERLKPKSQTQEVVPRDACTSLNWPGSCSGGHESPLKCHPGNARTLDFLQRFFMVAFHQGGRQGLCGGLPCVQPGKIYTSATSGLLHPLPIPRRPWSHLSLDFVTGLPPSQGNTVILVVVDRFSKAALFIPLPKLPLAKETAELIMNHIFRVFGIPQFWGAFCKLAGATASLSSGFHPESNGQTECINQDLETTLRCMAANNPTSWATYIIWAEYDHNTHQSSATGLFPFECRFGCTPHCSLKKSDRLTFPQPGVLSNAVIRPGGRLGAPFFRPPRDTNVRLIAATGWPLISKQVKEFG